MSVFGKINYRGVDGLRIGRFNLADNTNSIVYFLDELMIDSGPPFQYKFLHEKITQGRIEKVLLTHHHEDHSGNCAKVSVDLNIPVYIHKSGMKLCDEGFSIRMYQKAVWGNMKPFETVELPESILTNSGLELFAVHTPGHSCDHVCFFVPEKKWLFTGDLFLGVKPRLLRADEDLKEQIKSLEKILTYDFDTVFCSHKGVLENGHSLLEKKLVYLRELIADVEKYYQKGLSVDEVRKILFRKRELAEIISFNHLSGRNLISQCFEIVK